MPDGEVEGDGATHAEAEDVGLGDVLVLEQAHHIGGQIGAGERPVDVTVRPSCSSNSGVPPAPWISWYIWRPFTLWSPLDR